MVWDASAINGYAVEASDGRLWPGERVLISPPSVQEIDRGGRLIQVDANRQKIKDGAPDDPSITVDGAYEEKFLTYCGIR